MMESLIGMSSWFLTIQGALAVLACVLVVHALSLSLAAGRCGIGSLADKIPVAGHLLVPLKAGYAAWPATLVVAGWVLPAALPADQIHQALALACLLHAGFHAYLFAGTLSDGRHAGSGLVMGMLPGIGTFAACVLIGVGMGGAVAVLMASSFLFAESVVGFLMPLGKPDEYLPAIESAIDFDRISGR